MMERKDEKGRTWLKVTTTADGFDRWEREDDRSIERVVREGSWDPAE